MVDDVERAVEGKVAEARQHVTVRAVYGKRPRESRKNTCAVLVLIYSLFAVVFVAVYRIEPNLFLLAASCFSTRAGEVSWADVVTIVTDFSVSLPA